MQKRENVESIGEKTRHPPSRHQCIHHLLEAQAERNPEAIAIAAPGRVPLTYDRLRSHVDYVVNTLNAMGVGRSDRVAIVLPNGPEMAVTFIAVAAGATCAPLNPGFRDTEFDFCLSDLNAKALVIQSGMDSPARAVAQVRSIPVIELAPEIEEEAAIFTLTGGGDLHSANGGFAQPDDVALVLHTSGTTSRPKTVPLTQLNICTSAHNIRVALELRESDRCLNVMPLFHIGGLISATLSSLVAGASVVCTPGFCASQFLEWLEEFCPTWYTAAPIMHQAVLAQAAKNNNVTERSQLRFIRSSASPLPPRVMSELERVFLAPVIDSYGMTEASAQITSNPLPPRQRKPGSVGVAAGPEVAVLNEAGDVLPPNETGEIVIRGPNITHGYENDPAANESSATNGWFRTGDLGHMDADGYLFITGRLKEIIDRGGEKVAPREVDEALMDHPAVTQAVAFAVPHATLGEDVAAAVVIRENASVTEKEIREFVFSRLADYKVPSQVIIVDEIPKGPAGKLQRIGLADKLASMLRAEFVAPRNSVEEVVARIWGDLLRVDQVGSSDNFFALGGDSLQATQLVAQVRVRFEVELPLTTIFREPTVAGQALVIEDILLREIEAMTEGEAERIAA
jgi:acyl-CoA synthetase (AMP-forming)/AMP-acid ligase II/acyl carrier protein